MNTIKATSVDTTLNIDYVNMNNILHKLTKMMYYSRTKLIWLARRTFGGRGPHRLTARTPGFHPGNRSSILRGVTCTGKVTLCEWLFLYM